MGRIKGYPLALLLLGACGVSAQGIPVAPPPAWDLSDVQEGYWVLYSGRTEGWTSERLLMTIKVLKQVEAAWLTETWIKSAAPEGKQDMGYLLLVSDKGEVQRAWRAKRGDTSWAETPFHLVSDPSPEPSHSPRPEARKVNAGRFDCTRIEDHSDHQDGIHWYSKEVRGICECSKWGGLVASELHLSSLLLDVSTELEAVGKDAQPTIPLPREFSQ